MSDLMQWLLILVVAHNFFSTWMISGILDRMLTTLREMNEEMEKARRKQ